MNDSLSLDDFDIAQYEASAGREYETLTIWVPKEIKAKYDRLQALSGKVFGKKFKEKAIKLIDGVPLPKEMPPQR